MNQVAWSHIVGKVIDKRKKEPVAKDKVSVIKFNSKAVLEHINVDIKEDLSTIILEKKKEFCVVA